MNRKIDANEMRKLTKNSLDEMVCCRIEAAAQRGKFSISFCEEELTEEKRNELIDNSFILENYETSAGTNTMVKW